MTLGETDPQEDARVDGERGPEAVVRRAGTVDARPPGGPCPECGAERNPEQGQEEPFTEHRVEDGQGYCAECGRYLPDGTDRVDADLGRLAGVSDRGHVHAVNEDAMALGFRRDTGVVAAVVCDGVSSTRRSQDAARVAAETALTVLLGTGPEAPPESDAAAPELLLRRAVAAAADAVAALAAPDDPDAPSCTLAAALVEPSGRVTIGWVGDSRIYHLDGPGSRLLTVDHSWAGEQVAAGVLTPDAAMADPRAHAITRWLGAGGVPIADVGGVDTAGGLLLLCTDGLWNYVPDPADLAALADLAHAAGAADTPYDVAARLARYALDAGGADNVTVVAIPLAAEGPD